MSISQFPPPRGQSWADGFGPKPPVPGEPRAAPGVMFSDGDGQGFGEEESRRYEAIEMALRLRGNLCVGPSGTEVALLIKDAEMIEAFLRDGAKAKATAKE